LLPPGSRNGSIRDEKVVAKGKGDADVLVTASNKVFHEAQRSQARVTMELISKVKSKSRNT
jgi:hypothetical protein